MNFEDILRDLKHMEGFNFTDDAILYAATKIYISKNIEKQKKKSSTEATDKQKALMDKMKIKYPKDITKLEASKLIDERVGQTKRSEEPAGQDY